MYTMLLPCRFGCPLCKDDLSHYVDCPLIWNGARIAFPSSIFCSTLDRLCIVGPCIEALKVLAGVCPPTCRHILRTSSWYLDQYFSEILKILKILVLGPIFHEILKILEILTNICNIFNIS